MTNPKPLIPGCLALVICNDTGEKGTPAVGEVVTCLEPADLLSRCLVCQTWRWWRIDWPGKRANKVVVGCACSLMRIDPDEDIKTEHRTSDPIDQLLLEHD